MTDKPGIAPMTRAQWLAEGSRRFGPDVSGWRFVCPSCGHVASVMDWVGAGAQTAVAFSCIGRWTGAKGEAFGKKEGQPCNYAGGGLFKLNPVRVIDEGGTEHDVFAFADATEAEALAS